MKLGRCRNFLCPEFVRLVLNGPFNAFGSKTSYFGVPLMSLVVKDASGIGVIINYPYKLCHILNLLKIPLEIHNVIHQEKLD